MTFLNRNRRVGIATATVSLWCHVVWSHIWVPTICSWRPLVIEEEGKPEEDQEEEEEEEEYD